MNRLAPYYTLISSLPKLPPPFTGSRVPISRVKLDQRLNMLLPDDAATMADIQKIVQWHDLPMHRTDEKLVRQAKRLLQTLENSLIYEIVLWRLEVRTVMAALRRRRRGDRPPNMDKVWGCGRWNRHIVTHWQHPDFNLAGVFRWIPEANRMISEGDALGIEKMLLRLNWRLMGQLSVGHPFDFEAVVIYVLRWGVVARAATHDHNAARKRFGHMLEHAMESAQTVPATG
ncbi:MAG: DUF2764 family protein [Pseudomonadota bacterium]|nr:DUF2764 family protein [Pseudomonadota bacterium]